MKHSIIFAGSSGFSAEVLSFLQGLDNIEIRKVITLPEQPVGRGKKVTPNPVHAHALEHDLPLILAKTLKSDEIKKELTALGCDYLLVVAFGLIIPKWLLSLPVKEPLNIHASLLPRWRGASPIHKCIEHGDETTGICLMRMTEGLDEGPVFIQKEIKVSSTDMFLDVEKNLLSCSFEIIKTYFLEPNKYLNPLNQSGESTYAHKLSKEDGLISHNTAAETIVRKFRAFHQWPGVFFINKTDNQRVKIISMDLKVYEKTTESTQKIEVNKDSIVIRCHNGSVKITAIQFAGKKPSDIKTISHNKNHPVHFMEI